MALGEFELIEKFFAKLGPQHPAIACDVGDDCALLSIPFGYELAVSLDTLVAGVHFPEKNYSPYLLGHRALRVAASDLAAAGAAPLAFTLALTLPVVDEEWLADFSRGLSEAASTLSLTLIGGDTTRGPLTLSLQVHGLISKGRMLKRNGAKPGDLLYVSGELGAARTALDIFQQSQSFSSSVSDRLLQRYWQPQPRLALGVQLRNVASACIDISDGLLADAGHIASSSNVAIEIDSFSVPISSAVKEHYDQNTALHFALTGGDDYELCFTIPAGKSGQIKMIADAAGCALTCIGRVVEGSGVRCIDASGQPMFFAQQGYQHFVMSDE